MTAPVPTATPAHTFLPRFSEEDADLRDAVLRAYAIGYHAGVPDSYRQLAFSIILQRLLEPARTAAEVRQHGSGPLKTDGHIAEFLAQFRHADTHPARICSVAYWYWRRVESGVRVTDLESAYRAVRAALPHNVPDVIAGCIRAGRLIDGPKIDGRKSWSITPAGERYVEGLR